MSSLISDLGTKGQDPLLRQVVFDYRIVKEIGRGGMGAVYEAVHESIGQRAAIKVLSADYADDPDYVERFIAEARAASLVPHPGLVKIFNCGRCADGSPYILMEYLEGESLRSRQERLEAQDARIPLREALHITRQIASALDAVHKKGIVHRDLKPGNIQLCPDPAGQDRDQVKVVDFGIAKITQPGDAAARHTTEGKFLGTAIYASPEQCMMEGNVGTSSDVYSLGVMLHEMLAGRPPFVAGTGAVMAMHIFKQPRPLRELCPGVPDDLHELVHAMLRKKPEQRPTMAQLVARLDLLRLDRSPFMWRLHRHRRVLALSAAALMLGIVSGWALRTRQRHHELASLKSPPPAEISPAREAVPVPAAADPQEKVPPVQPLVTALPASPPAGVKAAAPVKRAVVKARVRHAGPPAATAPAVPTTEAIRPPEPEQEPAKPESQGEPKHAPKKYQPIR